MEINESCEWCELGYQRVCDHGIWYHIAGVWGILFARCRWQFPLPHPLTTPETRL